MLNKITIGISQAINAAFGDAKKCYSDEIEQDLESCFLVTPLTFAGNQIIGNRYEHRYPFMLQYFPAAKDYRAECNEVAEKLLNILEYITVDDALIRGTDMTAHVDDGVLNFEVTYKMHVFKQTNEDSEQMENLEYDATLKE